MENNEICDFTGQEQHRETIIFVCGKQSGYPPTHMDTRMVTSKFKACSSLADDGTHPVTYAHMYHQ